MGLAIGVVRVQGHNWVSAEHEIGFDGSRWEGDSEFASYLCFVAIIEGPHTAFDAFRPIDIGAVREWIRAAGLAACNEQRLLNLIDALDRDEQLFLYLSY